jgi:hypothetical protein
MDIPNDGQANNPYNKKSSVATWWAAIATLIIIFFLLRDTGMQLGYRETGNCGSQNSNQNSNSDSE